MPDNAVRAITHGLWGRKEQRTKDGLTRDDLRGRTAQDSLRGQPTQNHIRGQSTHDDFFGQPTQRRNVIYDWGLPEPRRNSDLVGPIFEFDGRRFESNPREQRTRRHESPTGGATRTASQRRRSPSPYSQNEGTNRDVNKSPPTDNEKTLGKRYLGVGCANRGRAQYSNQAMRTPYSVSQVDNPTRINVRDRVNAWGDQRFNENGTQGRTETYDIGEGEAQNSGDRNDWYRENDEGDGDLPRTRAASTAGSSTSLGDHKKEQDLMLAKLSLKKAEREESIGIERRSRNSSGGLVRVLARPIERIWVAQQVRKERWYGTRTITVTTTTPCPRNTGGRSRNSH
jgi:hypothetical protein